VGDKVFRDLEQKERKKPIKITDIAIEKVRRTRVFGFNDDENRFIQNQHKRLLQISKDKNNSEEVAIVIDIIQWDDEVVIGDKNRVQMEANVNAHKMIVEYPKNTVLVMHNHPSTSTFSGEDFKMFCDYEPIFVMTIVGNDGSVQVMEKDVDFDGQTCKIKYGELAENYKNQGYKNNGTKAMKYIIKHPSEFNILYKHGGKKNERDI
jgi:proteasome lid subunit RPN8/RPN11